MRAHCMACVIDAQSGLIKQHAGHIQSGAFVDVRYVPMYAWFKSFHVAGCAGGGKSYATDAPEGCTAPAYDALHTTGYLLAHRQDCGTVRPAP